MNGGAFDMQGLDALLDTLNALPEQMGKNALQRAGARALQPFIAVVKDIAPTDDPSETPDRPAYQLRESFFISTRLNDRQAKFTRKAGKNYAEVYAGTNDPVGHLIEFGHIRVAKARGTAIGWVPPQPFVSVAWNVSAGDVLGECAIALAEELDGALTRVVKRS